MNVWKQSLLGVWVGLILAAFAGGETRDESGYLWVSGSDESGRVASAADPLESKVKGGQERPAESPKPPATEWHRRSEGKPVQSPASGTAPSPQSPKGVSPPSRLPEDPGYRLPKAGAAPALPQGVSGAPAPNRLEQGKPLAPSSVPACDRTPCDWCGDPNCVGTCAAAGRARACRGAVSSEPACDEPWRLFGWPALRSRGFNIRGWVDQGVTIPAQFPSDRFNGPVTFNDRADEYQMNQLYLIAERETSTEGQGFDVGGRVDLLYGTDSRFTLANGLDDTWNGDKRFYGLAMPQLYAEFALNDWTVRAGHFYSILGYETVTAVDTFFYSRTYSRQYGEPFTHTGMLAKWQFNDRLSLSAGFHRGWEQWEDNNNSLGFLGGVTWTNEDSGTTIAFGITASNEQVGWSSSRTAYSVVVQQRLAQRLRYVLEHVGAYETNALLPDGSVASAEWFGVTNYLFFDLNPRWSFGLRYEWFADNDGARVRGLGAPRGFNFPPAGQVFPAYWNEISLGVHYKPHRNVTLRSEGRWDWADPVGTSDIFPFTDQTRRNQFLFATDLILQF